MTAWIVYQWTNTINGKRYIGYSKKTLKGRFNEHQRAAMLGSKCHFHNAIRKHGAEVFVGEVLFVEKSKRAAQETEILLILDRQPEYNKTLGGDCGPIMFGSEHPMFGVERLDLAERNRQRIWTEDARASASKKQTGKKASDETKFKMSRSRSGKIRGPYNVTSDGVSSSNKSRAGSEAAALAAKKAADIRWAKHRAAKLAAQSSEVTTSE